MIWEPINSAPQDGTPILVCVDSCYYPTTAIWASYHPNQPGKATWRDSPICGNKLSPTHWMPLMEKPQK